MALGDSNIYGKAWGFIELFAKIHFVNNWYYNLRICFNAIRMTKSVCPGLSTFNIHLTIHCLSTEGNICCAVSGNPNQPNLSIWGMLFGGVWYNIWSNSTIYVCCVVSSTALLQVVMLARIVFEQSQFSPAISVLTGKANYLTGKLSSPVWGKLLGEGLDPPGVALLAQNVVVQGVTPGG